MNELSLFTGSGGGVIASKFLLKWRTIGYVERNDHCQRVLKQRILDGLIDGAPIFGDIKAFIDSGCAELYRGITDVISAGFPCQPFSNAGKKEGGRDKRNAWPETAECIKIIRPRFCLLENVSALLTNGYITTIFSDLAALGYDFRYDVLPAASVGADHLRERLWIVAHAGSIGLEKTGCYPGYSEKVCGQWKRGTTAAKDNPADRINRHPKPSLLRKYYGVAAWVDRIKATGNGQYPFVVKEAWERLSAGFLPANKIMHRTSL